MWGKWKSEMSHPAHGPHATRLSGVVVVVVWCDSPFSGEALGKPM